MSDHREPSDRQEAIDQKTLGELYALVAGHAENQLSREETQRLECLLLQDPRLHEHFFVYMQLASALESEKSQLRSCLSEIPGSTHGVDSGAGAPPTSEDGNRLLGPTVGIECSGDPMSGGPPAGIVPTPGVTDAGSAGPSRSHFLWMFSGILTFSLVLVVGWLLIDRRVPLVGQGDADLSEPVDALLASQDALRDLGTPYVARVTRTIDCSWRNGAWAQTGSRLQVGQYIELLDGAAELMFDNNARVVLTGPARFVVQSKLAGKLLHGSASVLVPPEAVGFAVTTPTNQIIDHGTEFGVRVDAARQTEVHVFRGEVETQSLPGRPATESQRWLTGQAVCFFANGERVTKSAEPESFIRSLYRPSGVTAELKLVNPSFEMPDVTTVPDYMPRHGHSGKYPIVGWSRSCTEGPEGWSAFVQISPFLEPAWRSVVGPGATEGQQVGVLRLSSGDAEQGVPSMEEAWLFQSLGRVAKRDLGKTVLLKVDVAARTSYYANKKVSRRGPMWDGARIVVAFTKSTEKKTPGQELGTPAVIPRIRFEDGIVTMVATLTIDESLLDEEVFVRLFAYHPKPETISEQYHFDNVRCFVSEDSRTAKTQP